MYTTVFWSGIVLMSVGTAIVGRAMFYALVVPMTMPGAFFWRNQRFQEHAQVSGLMDRTRSGIVIPNHI